MSKKIFFNEAKEALFDLVYPKRCIFCGKTICKFGKTAICPKCAKRKSEAKVVRDDKYIFDQAAGALKYEGHVRGAMLKFKFHGIKYYGYTFAYKIYEEFKGYPFMKDAILCCVPSASERPYNQSEVIAEELSKRVNMKYIPDLLYKVRDINSINSLKKADRLVWVLNAFEVNPEYSIYGKNIVLVDDIFTTGATANECSRMLKMYGAEHIYVVCACCD